MTGFVVLGQQLPHINKRAGEVLDYVLDFSAWLGAGEVLSSVTATATAGITIGSSPAPAVNAGSLTVEQDDGSPRTIAAGEAAVLWLSGGSVGQRYAVTVTCTSGARTVQRSFEVRVVV